MKRRATSPARSLALSLSLSLSLSLASCDFTAFNAYLPRAQTAVFLAPNGYRSTDFGAVLAAVPSPDGRGYFAAGAGVGSSVGIYRVDLTQPPEESPEPSAYVCTRDAPCPGQRVGDPLAGVARWGANTACTVATAFGDLSLTVRVTCVGGASVVRSVVAPPTDTAPSMGFGRVLVGSPDDEGGLFFSGAPLGARAYVVRDTGAFSELAAPGVGPPSAETFFGEALAVTRARLSVGSPVSERALWLFVGAPGASAVHAFVGDPLRGAGFAPVACAPGRGGTGFGGVLSAGDFDGDGLADVAVSARRGVRDRGATVRVFFGAQAPALGGSLPTCDTNPWPGVDLACASGDGAQCEDADFGATLAAADLDADGRDELLVGAPNATVDGAPRAGAVFVARFESSTSAIPRWTYLRTATPQEGDELGVSLAALRTNGRTEPLVGSRRAGVRVFACSGLEGDRPGAPGLDARCRPAPR